MHNAKKPVRFGSMLNQSIIDSLNFLLQGIRIRYQILECSKTDCITVTKSEKAIGTIKNRQ